MNSLLALILTLTLTPTAPTDIIWVVPYSVCPRITPRVIRPTLRRSGLLKPSGGHGHMQNWHGMDTSAWIINPFAKANK